MTEGLITRIGKWIDSKWEPKATEASVINKFDSLSQSLRLMQEAFEKENAALRIRLQVLEQTAKEETTHKDAAELKKRLEQLELYVGMKRVADPTKSPVAKSAFSM